MLDTIGSSGYIHAVKLSPKPNTKNHSKLLPMVSRDRAKRLSALADERGAFCVAAGCSTANESA